MFQLRFGTTITVISASEMEVEKTRWNRIAISLICLSLITSHTWEFSISSVHKKHFAHKSKIQDCNATKAVATALLTRSLHVRGLTEVTSWINPGTRFLIIAQKTSLCSHFTE
jgi:hypothetical protein